MSCSAGVTMMALLLYVGVSCGRGLQMIDSSQSSQVGVVSGFCSHTVEHLVANLNLSC